MAKSNSTFKYFIILAFGIGIGILLSDKPRVPTGKCEKGKIYKITKVSDLFANNLDLHCIFQAAVEPNRVPQGPFYVDIISLAGSNHSLINKALNLFLSGKFISKVPCNHPKTINLGWNYFLGNAFIPFEASLGKISNFVNTHESWLDQKDALIFEYGQDLYQKCPDIEENLKTRPELFEIKKSPWNRNICPTNNFLDGIRLVGRGEDGGAIYLGILFLRRPLREDQFSEPLAFFSLVNYDFEVNKDFKIGQKLTPLSTDSNYVQVGFGDLSRMLCPFDDFLKSPSFVGKKIIGNTLQHLITFWNFLLDFVDGFIGSPDPARLNELFNTKPKVNPFAGKKKV